MLEHIYTGSLEYRNIEFQFVFDGELLTLITPKQHQHEVEWEWLKEEIGPGVYTYGKPLTVDVPFMSGRCYETNKQMIFLTHESSTVGSRNSTLLVNVVGVIEANKADSRFSRLTLSSPELNFIHPINRAYYQEFNFDDLEKDGAISIKTNGFDATTTTKRPFTVDGNCVSVHFSVGWKCSTKNNEPPIILNSNMIFEFEETSDYWFLRRLWSVAESMVQLLTFRQNAKISECALQAKFDEKRFHDIGTFKLTRDTIASDGHSLEKGRYISLRYLESHEADLIALIADESIYLRHIPKSSEGARSIDASSFVMTTAAFEWEFSQLYPDGVSKQDKRVKAEERALKEIDAAISNTTGEAKSILKFARKSIGFTNLEAKVIQASRDFDPVVGVFGKQLYSLNEEEFDYKTIGNRLANQRNDFAHGNIDKEFSGAAILDLLFLRYLIYALQLRRIGVSDSSIQRAINDLFSRRLALPEEKQIESVGDAPYALEDSIPETSEA